MRILDIGAHDSITIRWRLSDSIRAARKPARTNLGIMKEKPILSAKLEKSLEQKKDF